MTWRTRGILLGLVCVVGVLVVAMIWLDWLESGLNSGLEFDVGRRVWRPTAALLAPVMELESNSGSRESRGEG